MYLRNRDLRGLEDFVAYTGDTSLLPSREEVRKILKGEQEGIPFTFLAPFGVLMICTVFWRNLLPVIAGTSVILTKLIRDAHEDTQPEIPDEEVTMRQEDIFKSRMRRRFTYLHHGIKKLNLTPREMDALTRKLDRVRTHIEEMIFETLLKRTDEGDSSSRKLEELEKRVEFEFETLIRNTPLLR